MKTMTITDLRGNIYKIFDKVLNSGIFIEVQKGGKKLKTVPGDKVDKLKNLKKRPQIIKEDPDNLVNIHWDQEVNIDLP